MSEILRGMLMLSGQSMMLMGMISWIKMNVKDSLKPSKNLWKLKENRIMIQMSLMTISNDLMKTKMDSWRKMN